VLNGVVEHRRGAVLGAHEQDGLVVDGAVGREVADQEPDRALQIPQATAPLVGVEGLASGLARAAPVEVQDGEV
jgi:hypothetical protein